MKSNIEKEACEAVFARFPELEEDKIYEAIVQGVDNAIWRMITNATQMPCRDFYDTIKDAAETAFSRVVVSTADSIEEPEDEDTI